MSRCVGLVLGGLAGLALASSAHAAFTINLNFVSGTSAAAQTAFANAKSLWTSVISDYKPGVTLSGLTISCGTQAIDGAGNVLAQTGVTGTAARSSSVYSTNATIVFDSADFSNYTAQQATDIVAHEMGHALGIGSLWTSNGLYVNNSGQYTGANGLAAYKAEFNPNATFVPVELAGGAGTANAHWDEGTGGGATGIFSNDPTIPSATRDFRYELMTGWYNAPTYLSSLTRYSLMDLGYAVNAVPEPTTITMLALGMLSIAARRARRR